MATTRTFIFGILCIRTLISSAVSDTMLTKYFLEHVADGITYTKYAFQTQNTTILHVVESDSHNHPCDLRVAKNQRDTVSAIVKRNNAIVAVNGANYRRGGPFNGARLNLFYAPDALCCTGSFSAGALIFDHTNTIHLDFCKAAPSLTLETANNQRTAIKIDCINIPLSDHKCTLYDASYPSRSIYVDAPHVIIQKTKDAITYDIVQAQSIEIPAQGFIVVADKNTLQPHENDKIQSATLNMHLECSLYKSAVKKVLGGAGMLLEQGIPCDIYKEFAGYALNQHFGDEAAADFGDKEQQTWLIEQPHPRTALGISPNGGIIIIVADGRSTESTGVTLRELQDLFLYFGCTDALNIGGGGCSTLVIKGKVRNKPSQNAERPVSEAICFF